MHCALASFNLCGVMINLTNGPQGYTLPGMFQCLWQIYQPMPTVWAVLQRLWRPCVFQYALNKQQNYNNSKKTTPTDTCYSQYIAWLLDKSSRPSLIIPISLISLKGHHLLSEFDIDRSQTARRLQNCPLNKRAGEFVPSSTNQLCIVR